MVLVVLVGGLLGLPSPAGADTFFTPYLGSTFAAKYGPAEPKSKFVYGGDVMWLGTSGVGFELDFAYHPNFFEPGDDEELFDFDSDGNVLTFMGNLVFGYQGVGFNPTSRAGLGSCERTFPTSLVSSMTSATRRGASMREVAFVWADRPLVCEATSAISDSFPTSSLVTWISISATSRTGAAPWGCRSGSEHFTDRASRTGRAKCCLVLFAPAVHAVLFGSLERQGTRDGTLSPLPSEFRALRIQRAHE